jgi:hypothetical protein
MSEHLYADVEYRGQVYLDAELMDGKWFFVDESKRFQAFRYQDKVIPFTQPVPAPQHTECRRGRGRLLRIQNQSKMHVGLFVGQLTVSVLTAHRICIPIGIAIPFWFTSIVGERRDTQPETSRNENERLYPRDARSR